MNTPSWQRLRSILAVAIPIAVAAIAVVFYETDVFERTELDTVDARFSIRGETKPPDDIVVVGIDDKTLNAIDKYPLPRGLHADVIDRLDADGAKTIAYDIQFTEQTTPAEDNRLVQAVKRAGGMVLATTEVDEQGHTNVFGGDDVVASLGARAAAGNVVLDPGGIVRRVVPTYSGLVSFPVATAEAATGSKVDSADFPDDGAWIDFHGPNGTIQEISFSDVLKGNFDPGTFKDKTVVVGGTAITLQDTHPTSSTGDDLMSGPEIQANAIDTVERGLPLDSTPGFLDVLIIIAFAFVPILAGLRLSPLRSFLVAVGVGALYLIAGQLAFSGPGLVLPMAYPLGALAVSAVGTLGLQYVSASVDRERVRGTFTRFVPEQVVDNVLEQTGDDLRLGAEETECTVLFSDIRGFTTFSEKHEPREVVAILNDYLQEMSAAIFAHGGTITSYIGDGIMAVFGAPIAQTDHAQRALAAAREMIDQRLPRFNEQLRERGIEEPFRIGVGLNTGVVVHGNIGSDQRLDYTAIGDTVNTAARLEGMTKGTGHEIFLSETTHAQLEDTDGVVFVEEMPIRGRAAKMKVWAR